jgi:hypothetical protein
MADTTQRKRLSNKELEQKLFQDYLNEVRDARKQRIKTALHLYSKRVYRAYHNVWKFIDRRLLTPEEISIMKQLGCYKPSRTELGTRWFPPMHRAELPVE